MASIKQHIKNHKTVYTVVGTTVVIAGVAYVSYRLGTLNTVENIVSPKIQQVGIINRAAQHVTVEFVERSTPSKVIALMGEDGESFTQAFSSISEAAKQTGINRTAISNCVNGHASSAAGFVFRELEIGD